MPTPPIDRSRARDRLTTRIARATLIAGGVLVMTSSAAAQRKSFQPEDHYRLRSVGSPELSPDGTRVAYVESALDLEHKSRSQLWVIALADGKRTLLSGEETVVSSPRWSPDGQAIAFVDGASHIVVVHPADLTRETVATFQSGNEVLGYAGTGEQFAWSPDSRSIAYLSADQGAEPPPGDPQVITRYHYKTVTGVSDNRRWHIYVVALSDKKPRALTSDARYHDLNLAFSPKGDEIAFASNRTADPDRQIDLNIYTVRVRDGVVRQVTRSPISEYAPRWSRDGSRIAYLMETSTKTSRETRMNDSHVWVVGSAGGPGRNISGVLDRRTSNFAWAADGASLLFTVADHGNTVMYRGYPDARRPIVEVADGTVGAFSVAAVASGSAGVAVATSADRIAFVLSNARSPGDIYVRTAREAPLALTHVNADLLAERDIVEPVAYTFKSVDGLRVEGFLTPPLNRRSGEKYPLIVQIHGGPHGQQGPAFNLKSQVYAGVGWATVMINYRGSSGYGQKFADGTYRDWNGLEGKDVLAGIDSILARTPWLDARRVSVEGGSYGGQLTNWLITQRQSFRSAIPASGISNLVTESYMIFAADYPHQEYGGFPWERDIAQQMWNRSALNHVSKVKTPVMFIHGLLDQDVPLAEAQMFYLALKQVGVETVLVQYPREGHGLREPGHVVDAMQRSIAWHGRFLGAVQ